MNFFKLGCNWGTGKPTFYDMLKKLSIVICAGKYFEQGDLVAITQGYTIIAIAEVTGKRYPCTENISLEEYFNRYDIDYEDWNYVADAMIFQLPKENRIRYEQQKGICSIKQEDIIDKISTTFNKIKSDMLIEDCKKLLLGNHNLILTGAPGTGKTYLAKEIAKAMDAETELVQFHPSYDYTDFVEGLRPSSDSDSNRIIFAREDGIFKAFCAKALKNLTDSKKTANELSEEATFREAYDELIDQIREGNIREIPLRSPSMKMEIVDVSNNNNIILRPESSLSGMTYTVSCNRLRMLSIAYKDISALESITNIDKALRAVIGGCNSSAYWAVLKYLYSEFYKNPVKNNGESARLKNFVFIIDEINRGEMSKIFGELFYSIDSGYRGVKGRVKTQYQNLVEDDDVFADGFFVPENVYVIGTMNDIDRSIESIDFAMRRRFAWKEITAESRLSMLDDANAWGGNKPTQEVIDEIKVRMNHLNACIIDEYRTDELIAKDKIGLTKAYQIGASYFLKLSLYQNDFAELWSNHIEGLLYEYLRGSSNIETKMNRLKNAFNDTASN